MRRSSTLRLGPLVAVMYFTVSGGPFGLEGLVGSVGPGVALLLLVLTPVVFSVPETLLIGELASMLPAEGGYYVWVKRAFGRFWGFWNGWLSWVYSLIDMAIYPVLFLQYIRFFAPGLGGVEGWLIALVLIWGATWLNLRGTRAVGTASGWLIAAVLAPFALLAVVALGRWVFGPAAVAAPFRPFAAPGQSFVGALGIGISQSIWNYSGWDNASTVGGEIEHATATYPRALARALPLVTIVYLVTIVPVLALTDWRRWTDGAWPALAATVVGPCCSSAAGSPSCAARSGCRSGCGCSRASPCCRCYCSSPRCRSRCRATRSGCPVSPSRCCSPRWGRSATRRSGGRGSSRRRPPEFFQHPRAFSPSLRVRETVCNVAAAASVCSLIPSPRTGMEGL